MNVPLNPMVMNQLLNLKFNSNLGKKMTVNKVEVFECQKCARLSRSEEDITKCLAKHEADDIKAAQRTADLTKINVVKFHIVNNLKTRKAEELAFLLIEAAAMLGFDLSFRRFVTDNSYAVHNSFIAEGNLTIPVGKKNPSGFNAKLDCDLETLFRSSIPQFNDFLRFINGVESNGGCYGGSFKGTVTIKPDQIPAIKNLIDEQSALTESARVFVQRKHQLSALYVKERLPLVKITDICYLNIKDMADEINGQIKELTANYKKLLDQLAAREKEIREADDEESQITPGPEFSYNESRLKELNILLEIKP